MLHDLKNTFDENDDIKRNKIYNKFFNVDFVMKNNETLIFFLTRYINIVVRLELFNYDLMYHFERNFTHQLRKNVIVFFTIIKDYYTFVQQLKIVNSRQQTLNQIRSLKSEYSKSNSLTRKKKKHFDNIENCYKCHQSKYKTNDKNASCKRVSWILKNAKQIN